MTVLSPQTLKASHNLAIEPVALPRELPRLSEGHIPALDGVRGMAILLVLFFHFAIIGGSTPVVRLIQKTWGFGWVGVDLFFVLSGFLITGILLDAKNKSAAISKKSYFVNFYARRTVRIFPLYFGFLALFLIILPRVMPNFYAIFGRPPCGAWAYWLYVYNFAQGSHNAATFAHSLGVTWSLCIEEQFYLVWPTVVLLLAPRGLLRMCAFLIAMPLLLRAVLTPLGFSEAAVSQWTIVRTEALAVGAGLAILMRTVDVRPLIKPAWIALFAVPIFTLFLNLKFGSLNESEVYHVVGPSTLAIMFGALLLLTITSSPGGPLKTFFSNPAMRFLGRYSYGIYIFNQPVKFLLLEYVFDPDRQLVLLGSKIPAQFLFFALAATITIAVALISWNLFEKHFLKLKAFFPMDHRPTLATAASEAATGGRSGTQFDPASAAIVEKSYLDKSA